MATRQELIEQGLRMTIGDLTVQTILMRAEIAELQQIVGAYQAAARAEQPQQSPPPHTNGLDTTART